MTVIAEGAAGKLLERAEALSELGEALAAVRARVRGRMALVCGEAGIGKTALLQSFCGELDGGARVLWAACDPLSAPRPLGPLLDVARVTGGELRERVESGAKPHDVAAALIDELEGRVPAVAVLEDIHWADEATLDVVRLVARRLEAVPALFVASYRDEQLHRVHPLRVLLGELPGSAAVTRVELHGLSRAAVARLAQPTGVDADELHEKTAGNPFFVTEVLAAGTERVPQTVRDAVLARVARLSPEARALLDAVAVVPRRTEVWLLEALTEGALAALDECLGSGILRVEADGIAFRHEVARLAIEESIAPDHRVALHRGALAALTEPAIGAPDLARLAHHAEAAGDSEAVLRFAPAAAEHAAAVGAHWEAQAQYARALRFGQALDAQARADLLEWFANEGFLTDMREEAVQALDEALSIHRARGDLVREAEALRLRARLTMCIGRTPEAKADARGAVAILEEGPPGPELARAYSGLSHVSLLRDEGEEAIRWGLRAIKLAERVGDTEALVNALNNVGTVELARGTGDGREKLERSLKLAHHAGLETDVGRAYINLCASFARRRDWRLVDEYAAPGIEYCRARGMEAWLQHLLAAKAESELAQGRWSDAADTAMLIIQGPRVLAVGSALDAPQVLALVRARRGDPEYWALLDEALETARSAGDLQCLAPIAAALAETLWLEERLAEIGPQTEQAFELALEHGEPSFVGELALWRWRAGLLAEPPAGAEELYRLQIAGECEQAARIWQDKGCPYEAALALADSNDEAALRLALDQLQSLGARPAAAIVARRLRERGARRVPRGPRPSTRENPAGLTPRELEVLALLADGLRNAEIAKRLVVAKRTVDHHVSAILRKLDARTRGEAAAQATRLGLTAQDT
jgi:DNA-binding CsgD family transcriptional regulator/tetratricopeptide (TPR) repeat protein